MLRNTNEERINIAVIGAGTGLTAAWALEIQNQFNVNVFEAEDRLGGHIHTVTLKGKKVEVGAEYIGNKGIYPNTHQLFSMLNVTLEPFELNMVFHHLSHPEYKIILPPIMHTFQGNNEFETDTDENNTSCLPPLKLFSNKKRKSKQAIQPDTYIDPCTLTKEMQKIINLYLVIKKAKKELANRDEFMTLEDFINKFTSHCPEFLCKRNKFAEQVLYALIAAGWGAPISAVKKFNAKYAMHYLESGKTWFDAPDGLSTYIKKMESECTHTAIKRKVKIKKLVPVLSEGKLKYQLLCDDGHYIENEDGTIACYEDVIIATPAYVSHELIADINTTNLAELIKCADESEKEKITETIYEIEALYERLKQVDYFNTTIVFHQDQRYECHPNTVIHTRYDGKQAYNTSCKRWKFAADEIPIMKTWVLPGQPMPNDVLYVAHYRHPLIDERYCDAQQALHDAQAKLGLHFGGILSGSNDAHESGITVSLEIAARLCLRENCLNENPRLAHFPNVINRILSADAAQKIDIIHVYDAIMEAISKPSSSYQH